MKKLTMCIALAVALMAATLAHAQAPEAPAARPAEFTCSPAPCVLPPTLVSAGALIATDTTVASNPLNRRALLSGSYGDNCAQFFYLSTDRGSDWALTECGMPGVQLGQRYYLAADEPSVGYDLKGNAYVSAVYDYATETEDYSLVAVQKSSDGDSWGKPRVALLQPGVTVFYLTHLAVDASASSPRAGAVYVSGMLLSNDNSDNQVWVAHSDDGGETWKQVAVDRIQKYPEQDAWTRMAVGKDGTVYVTWLRCRGGCHSASVMLSTSSDGGNIWSSPQRVAKVEGGVGNCLTLSSAPMTTRPSRSTTATGHTPATFMS